MKTIKVPNGLTEEEFAEFVREEVRKVGGDPDTMYPIDYGIYKSTHKTGDHTVVPVLETFEVKFNYGNYTPSNYTPSNYTPSNYTPSNYTDKGVELTVIEDEHYKYCRSASEIIDECSKIVKESEYVRKNR